MKWLLILLVGLFVGCINDATETGYQTLEIDMTELCADKEDGWYYVGPKDGYNSVNVTEKVKMNEGPFSNEFISVPEDLIYVHGKGFALECPRISLIKIVWY